MCPRKYAIELGRASIVVAGPSAWRCDSHQPRLARRSVRVDLIYNQLPSGLDQRCEMGAGFLERVEVMERDHRDCRVKFPLASSNEIGSTPLSGSAFGSIAVTS